MNNFFRFKQDLRDARGLWMTDHRFTPVEKYSRFGELREAKVHSGIYKSGRLLCFKRRLRGTCKYYFSRGGRNFIRVMTVCQTRW